MSATSAAARLTGIALLLLGTALGAQAQPYELRKLASQGDPAPRLAGTFQSFQSVVTNAAGEVAFTATWQAGSDDLGHFIHQDGVLRTIAFRGDAGPPGLGGEYGGFSNPGSLGGGGVFAFPGRLANSSIGGGETLDGLFVDVHGVQTALHLEGEAAPGPPGETFERFACPSVNASGAIAFAADLLDAQGSSSRALFVHDASGTRRIVSRFDPAPASVGGTFGSYVHCPYLDDTGRVLFFSYLFGSSADQGLFVVDGNAIDALVLSGANAPGTSGGHYTDLSIGDLAHAGGIAAFRASIGGSPSSSTGLFRIVDGVHAALAVHGQPLPPALGNGVFEHRFSDPSAGGGAVAFTAIAQYGGELDLVRTLLSQRSGVVTPVAVAGDPAPGGGTFTVFDAPAMNAKGDIAFIASTWVPSSSGVFFAEQVAPDVPLLPGIAVPGLFGLVLAVSLSARARRSLRTPERT